MPSFAARNLLLPPALHLFMVAASPTPLPTPSPTAEIAPRDPRITPSPTLQHDRSLDRRDLFDSFDSYANSILDGLGSAGSAIPSYVASGIPDFFQDFPTGDDVQSSLGLDDEQVDALPTQVLNLPPYANWTDEGWNVRFHGNVYKQPDTDEETLNDLADILLIGVDTEDLPEDQAEQARNVTASIFVLQQDDVRVPSILLHGNNGSSEQEVQLPYNTTTLGDFEAFIPIDGSGLTPGNETKSIQTLETRVENTTLSNASAYFVPPEGITIVSDIDDILRETKIYAPRQGLLNSFARSFRPWEDMPGIYSNWSQSLPDAHFHYLTTTPEQVTRIYMDYIFATYPAGSFDTRPLNFSDISATLSIRKHLLDIVFETFPERRFVLVADTSNSDVMSDYPALAKEHPEQVSCILLRNTSATDPEDKFPYDTSGFEGIDQEKFMFFVHSEDLMGLDLDAGDCYNDSVKQNLTFGYQGLPFGLSDDDGDSSNSGDGEESGAAKFVGGSYTSMMVWAALGAVALTMTMM